MASKTTATLRNGKSGKTSKPISLSAALHAHRFPLLARNKGQNARILHRESENYGRDVQNIIDGSYVPSWKIKLREKLFEEDVRDYFRPKSRELDEWRAEFAKFGREEFAPEHSGSYPFSVRSGTDTT